MQCGLEIFWCPSHEGILRNEMVNHLANLVCEFEVLFKGNGSSSLACPLPCRLY